MLLVEEHRLAEKMCDLGAVVFDVVEFIHINAFLTFGDAVGDGLARGKCLAG